jgi:mycothiol synthase
MSARAMVGGRAPLRLADAPSIAGLRFYRPAPDEPALFARLADLVRETSAADEVPWAPTAAMLEEELSPIRGVDLATDVVLGERDGHLVAVAAVDRVVRDGAPVYGLSGSVHPDHRRLGIGRALLRENLRRAGERAAAEPAGPVVVRSTVDENEAGHRALLEAHGFEVVRWFFLMKRGSLEDVPDAPLPPGLEFRSVTPDQHRRIFDAEVEAFRDHWGNREHKDEDFVETFQRAELDTSLWVVAWAGDEVAGVAQNWIWAAENASLGVARGWHERISVRRPWRRLGVGRAITAESLHRFAAAGMTETMLGVDAANPTGALRLYEGLGFTIDSRARAYDRLLRA